MDKLKNFHIFVENALKRYGPEREKLFLLLKKAGVNRIFPEIYPKLLAIKNKPDLNKEMLKFLSEDERNIILSFAYPIYAKELEEIGIRIKFGGGNIFKNIAREAKRFIRTGGTVGNVVRRATKGWSLRLGKEGLSIKTSFLKAKLSKKDLMIGGAVALGAILALTPAGPAVIGALGTIASKAGALGLTALSSVASFASKKGVSLLQAAKELGIPEDKVKEELQRLVGTPEYEQLVNAITSEGAKEAEPQGMDASPLLLGGLGLTGLLLLLRR